MTKRIGVRQSILCVTLAAMLLGGAAAASAQVNSSGTPTPAPEFPSGYKPPLFYIHGSLGFGLDWMSSSDISDLMDPYSVSGFGLSYCAGIRVGLMNIFQYEHRIDGSAEHNLYDSEDESKVEMTHAIPSIDLFKFNPLFWLGDGELSVFLVYGTGRNAKYYDEEDSGWKNGDANIYGVELSVINKFMEAGVSFEYRSITYKTFDLAGYGSITTPFKSSFFLIGFHVGFGFGS